MVLSMEEGNLSVLPELEEGWCLQPPLNYRRDRGRHKWCKGCVSLIYIKEYKIIVLLTCII